MAVSHTYRDGLSHRKAFRMRREVTITADGQVTIPGEIRQALGVAAGDTLMFESDKHGVRLTTLPIDPLGSIAGALRVGDGLTLDQINDQIRAWRDREE
jgi:AbrB family looped-hinge helix DNA binding protein